ncbi:MAG: hypothetical protein JNK48_18495 [Bryobacterales bacterium]|nr:hypothetical protein [Bryobacterales bacterium]
MPVWIALFAVTASTLQIESAVRSGCDPSETTIATLPANTPVEVRSALSGGSGTCYKIVATHNGREIAGYVPAKALASTDSFDQARREARSFGATTAAVNEQAKSIVRQATAKSGREHPAAKAWALVEANQPAEALRLLENDLLRYPVDPYLHAVAGIAYYRMDNLDRAILHWKESIAIEANPSIEAMLKRAQREKTADKGSERMVGNRVVLRYERSTLSEPFAQAMLQVLDEEYTRVSYQLGCRASEKVTAVATSRQSYFAATQAAEWSGGLYDGRIHVPVAESRQVSADTRRTFAHELVHACLHELGQWPSWLHEGLAQKFSGESMSSAHRAAVDELRKQKALPKLSQLGQNWSRLSSRHAEVAYTLALYGAEKLIELKASTGLGNVLRNPAAFPAIEAELDRALAQ